MPAGRKPDFVLYVKPKAEGSHGRRVGSAWSNDDGSFAIKLDPAVLLDWRDEVYISLYPADRERYPRKAKKGQRQDPIDEACPPGPEGDIPF
jgi:hypothetical protein